jgi:prepilin-type N-terminal cleavage/methylation domain-containing protein
MKGRDSRMSDRHSAFTLIELLIGMVVVAMLIGLIASAINQTAMINAGSGARTKAIRELDVSIDTLRRDIQMAQQVNAPPNSGFPLNLSWKEWDNTAYVITYRLDGSLLKREVEVNGSPSEDKVLASDISLIKIDNLPYSSGSLSISVTSTVGGFKPASESRTFRVLPRTGT